MMNQISGVEIKETMRLAKHIAEGNKDRQWVIDDCDKIIGCMYRVSRRS